MEPAIKTTIYHCPGCGTRVHLKRGRQEPVCPKCGVMLRVGEAPKAGRRNLILILAALGVMVGVVIYLLVR